MCFYWIIELYAFTKRKIDLYSAAAFALMYEWLRFGTFSNVIKLKKQHQSGLHSTQKIVPEFY